MLAFTSKVVEYKVEFYFISVQDSSETISRVLGSFGPPFGNKLLLEGVLHMWEFACEERVN